MKFTENETTILNRFLDKEGRIKNWPSKREKQKLIFKYLAQKFEANKTYTEFEINLILASYHTFNDHFLLRRGLVDYGYLKRERDGSAYWVNNERINGITV